MGMRQTVQLTYGDGKVVAVYSHWDGDNDCNHSPLAQKVRTALERRERWGDDGYLARIIISEIIRDGLDDEAGYGIYPDNDRGASEYPTIEVELSKQTVNGMTFEQFIRLGIAP